MHVEVVRNAGPGCTPEVQPDIDPLRSVGVGESDLGIPREPDDLAQFFVARLSERGDMAVRYHHEMAVVVGIEVQDDEGVRTARHDEVDRCKTVQLYGGLVFRVTAKIEQSAVNFWV